MSRPTLRRAYLPGVALVALVVSLAAPASAQDIYRRTSPATLTPVGPLPVPDAYDAAGNAWIFSPDAVTCTTPDGQESAWDPIDFTPTTGIGDASYTVILPLPDGSGALIVGWRRRFRPTPSTVRWATLRCGEEPVVLEADTDALPVLQTRPRGPAEHVAVALSADEACFVTEEGLRCIAHDEGAVTTRLLVDARTLSDALALNPGLATSLSAGNQDGLAPVDWDLRLPRVVEGRLLVIAEAAFFRERPANQPNAVAGPFGFLLEVDPATGALARVLEPGPPPDWAGRGFPPGNPLSDATDLFYEPRLDALLVFPVYGRQVVQLGDRVQADGVSMLVIPLGDEPPAFMDLTAAVVPHLTCSPAGCDEPRALREGVALPDGTLRFGLLQGTVELSFDPAALDLDQDGLTAAEEAALGSSDYRLLSDGWLLNDALEARIAGTDPSDPTDDPARALPRERHYVVSGLIRRALPEGVKWRTGVIRGGGIAGPLCAFDPPVCITRDGARVALPAAVDGSYTKSQDGAWLISSDGGPTISTATGQIADDLPAHVGPVVMVDAEHYYLGGARETGDWRVQSAGSTAYDHEAARCDSALGPCDPDPPVEPPPNVQHTPADDVGIPRLVGYLPGAQRALMAVTGVWERFLVLIHPTEEPVVLARGRNLAAGWRDNGLPTWMVPTPEGDVLYAAGVSDGLNGTITVAGLLDGWGGVRGLSTVEGLRHGQPPAVFWGEHIVVNDVGNEAPWEIVRYEGGAQPGDVLILKDMAGIPPLLPRSTQLYRSGPRGGAAPQFSVTGLPFKDASGLDMRADGTVCIADRGYGNLVVQARGNADGWTPLGEARSASVQGIRDCLFDADGGVVVLTDLPTPRLVRFDDGLGTAPTLLEEFDGAPRALLRRADGAIEVDDPAHRGAVYLRDGRRVHVAMDWFVYVDGEAITQLKPPSSNYPVERQGWIKLIERPDGLLVGVYWGIGEGSTVTQQVRPLVLDPETGESWPLSATLLAGRPGVGLAVVPFGPRIEDGPAPTMPGPAAGAGASPDDASSGCSIGPPVGETGGWPALLGLLGLLARSALRRRHGARQGRVRGAAASPFARPSPGPQRHP